MFSEITNPFLNVRNKVRTVEGEWVDQVKPKEILKTDYSSRISVVDGNLDLTVFSVWGKKIIIDSLSFGTNANAHPVLWGNQEHIGENFNGNLFVLLTKTGGGSTAYPNVLNAQGSDYLELEKWEGESRDSVTVLKKPVILPQGGELRFRSTSSRTGELSYKVIWREIEE